MYEVDGCLTVTDYDTFIRMIRFSNKAVVILVNNTKDCPDCAKALQLVKQKLKSSKVQCLVHDHVSEISGEFDFNLNGYIFPAVYFFKDGEEISSYVQTEILPENIATGLLLLN
ncbi:uncharacterized protein LOC111043704 isoform X2 [Nilaparvata lugens]|nr:uncharacterized protein LOC111043704 isoform X2 [Nilaparvata lugens]